MRIWTRNKTSRTPINVMGHTGYATDEGAVIPWPVIEYLIQSIEQTREDLAVLNEEIRAWHNRIPDGEERVEAIRRRHDEWVRPVEAMSRQRVRRDSRQTS